MVEPRITYAQNGEDVRAWRALRHVGRIFYVEVGAFDPYEGSVTAGLSAMGASGILVEPEPAAAERLRDARPRDLVVPAAASDRTGLLGYVASEQAGCGRVASLSGRDTTAVAPPGSLAVPAVRLSDVFESVQPPDIHFMSIDVEGHEQAALAGADLARWRPWLLCVEATWPNSREPSWQTWEPDVLRHDYLYVAFDGLNRWYVAREHEDLVPQVEEPFGVHDRALDGWVPAEVQALREQAHAAREEANRTRALAEARATQIEARATHIEALRADLDAACSHIEQLREENTSLHLRASQVEHALQAVTSSKAWRITAPLRIAMHASKTVVLPAAARTPGAGVRGADALLARNPRLRARVVAGLAEHPELARRLRRYREGQPVVGRPDVRACSFTEARRSTGALALASRYEAGCARP